MYLKLDTEIFRVLYETPKGSCLISCENPVAITFVSTENLEAAVCVKVPPICLEGAKLMAQPTPAIKTRMNLIKPLIDNEECITDEILRRQIAKEIAQSNGTTYERVRNLYYRYLATGSPMVPKSKHGPLRRKVYDNVIKHIYYGYKRPSLNDTYCQMLSEHYTDSNGQLLSNYPSFDSFHNYFYRNKMHQTKQCYIARNGLTNCKRNMRPLLSSQYAWHNRLGYFQMDATVADIYLVDEYNRKEIIGRPNIYLAVDTASRLIAGVHVGMEQGEQSVLACLANSACDKVEFCRKYGIEIMPEQWPHDGLPKRTVVDRGREFSGSRIEELCIVYGMESERLPPFRPDLKGMVEKSFDLLQSLYKPLLRGKGIIDPDSQERFGVDYRTHATLTLKEFTTIVLHCIVNLNSARVLRNMPPEAVYAQPTAAGLWHWSIQNNRSDLIPVKQEDLYCMALPRADAMLTKTGLIFRDMRYLNFEYIDAFSIKGKCDSQMATVAYDEENTSQAFIVADRQYIQFKLAPSLQRYGELDIAEYEALRLL